MGGKFLKLAAITMLLFALVGCGPGTQPQAVDEIRRCGAARRLRRTCRFPPLRAVTPLLTSSGGKWCS